VDARVGAQLVCAFYPLQLGSLGTYGLGPLTVRGLHYLNATKFCSFNTPILGLACCREGLRDLYVARLPTFAAYIHIY
jgi:hypothetical protein